MSIRHSLFTCLFISLLATSALSQARSPVPVPQWDPLGPLPGAGTAVFRLQTSTLTPNLVYASSYAGILRSNDRGQSWSVHVPWSDDVFHAAGVAVAPSQPTTMAIGRLLGGIAWSVDSGATFVDCAAPAEMGAVYRTAFDPVVPDTLLLAAASGVWRTQDAGATFTKVLDATGSFAYRLAMDPSNRLRVYAVIPNQGLYVSLDGGDSWTQNSLPAGMGTPLTLAVDPTDGRRVLLGGAGVALSEDEGASFGARTLTDELVDSLAFDPLDRDRFLAGVRFDGIHESTDRGLTWSPNHVPGLKALGGHPYAMLFSPTHPDELLVGGLGGFARSVDSGASFVRSNSGLDHHAYATSLVADPGNPLHLVAKTGGSVYVSTDGGLTWGEGDAPRALAGTDVVADNATPGRFYTGGLAGRLMRSDDGGWNWSVVFDDPVIYFFDLEPHPSLPNVLFGAGRGVQRSDDGGVTFTSLGAPANWIYDLEVNPMDPDVLYASNQNQMFFSHDGGATWSTATTPPPGIVRGIESDPSNPLRAWATTPFSGIYRTSDGGVTWSQIAPSVDSCFQLHLARTPGQPLLGTDLLRAKAYGGRSGGTYLGDWSRGLATVVSSFFSTPTEVYAATQGSGIHILR